MIGMLQRINPDVNWQSSVAIAFLPLGGGEFGVLGVALLVYAMYLLAKQINRTTCDIIV
jgi:hypothetical protein